MIRIEGWSAEKLEQWLSDVLHGIEHVPPSSRDSELHLDLIDIYDATKSAPMRRRFAEAVAKVFRSIPPTTVNAEILFTAIHLVAYMQPPRIADLLHQLLFLEVLRPMAPTGKNLHTLLAETVGVYEITDEVADYLQRSARISADIDYVITAMRVLAAKDRRLSLSLLESAIGIGGPAVIAALASHLGGFAATYGYRGLYEWWNEREESLLATHYDEVERLVQALVSRYVVDETCAPFDEDPYRMILTAHIHSARQPISPQELLDLAKMIDTIDKEQLANICKAILDRQTRTNRAWAVMIQHTDGWTKVADVPAGSAVLIAGGQSILTSPDDADALDFISSVARGADLNVPSADQLNDSIAQLEQQFEYLN